MTNVTAEREFTGDYDVWQIYVGGMTPAEFIAPYKKDAQTAIHPLKTRPG